MSKDSVSHEPSIDKHKRRWVPRDEKEERILKRLIALCQEKLSFSLVASIPKEVIRDKVNKLYNDELTFKEFDKMDTDAFYDYMVGQGRLFDDTQM